MCKVGCTDLLEFMILYGFAIIILNQVNEVRHALEFDLNDTRFMRS